MTQSGVTWDLSLPAQLSAALGPDLLLAVGGIALMIYAAWRPDSATHQRRVGVASLWLIVATMVAVCAYAVWKPGAGGGAIAVDSFRWACDLIFLVAALCTVALSIEYNPRKGLLAGESHVLVLFATSGMMLLAAARDLMIVFLGIELMSVAAYVLAGLDRRSARSAEGALKYFLLGAFSTAFLLYGIALVYGASGTTNLTEIGERVGRFELLGNPMFAIGAALLLVGFGFKVAAAPFHMWAPDVYEGAPTPITAFMAAAVKAAAFAAFLRVWLEAFPAAYYEWHDALWYLAIATMIVGNAIALTQRNVKRMLAYSSIAQAGYILVAVVAGSALGASAFVFYLTAYTFATMGAFGVIVALGNAGEPHSEIDDYAGLWNKRPWLAIAMAVCMLALLGFPVFGGLGFVAKYYMLQAALQTTYAGRPYPQVVLAVVLVLTSVVSAGYYLRLVSAMFMRAERSTEASSQPLRPMGWLTTAVVGVNVALLLAFGLMPLAVIEWARASVPAVQQSALPPSAYFDPALPPITP